MASFLKYLPTLKFPNISKNERCLSVSPMMSISIVRIHFCEEVIFGLSGFLYPEKKSFKGTIPAAVNRRVSSWGMREAEFRTL